MKKKVDLLHLGQQRLHQMKIIQDKCQKLAVRCTSIDITSMKSIQIVEPNLQEWGPKLRSSWDEMNPFTEVKWERYQFLFEESTEYLVAINEDLKLELYEYTDTGGWERDWRGQRGMQVMVSGKRGDSKEGGTLLMESGQEKRENKRKQTPFVHCFTFATFKSATNLRWNSMYY